MPDQNLIQAMRGGRLTAADYAGMTPEQMQAVHGMGMQNKQMALGMFQQHQEEARHQRQESFQREQFRHQKEVSRTQLELAQRQDVRQELQRVTDNMFKMATMKMQEKQLQMAQQMQSSNLAMNSMKMGQMKAEMRTLQQQQEATRKFFQDKEFNVEGIPMSGAEATAMGFTPIQLMELKLKESAANQANPVAWRQKISYFEDMATQLGVKDPVDVMTFALIASEGTGTITKDQIMDLNMKNDPLFRLKPEAERVSIVNNTYELFAKTGYTDHRALAKLFERDEPEAAAALEKGREETLSETPAQPQQETPPLTDQEASTVKSLVSGALGEQAQSTSANANANVPESVMREINPALGQTNMRPILEAFAQTSAATRPTSYAMEASPPPDLPEEPAQPAAPAEVPLEQSSGIIGRAVRVRQGSAQTSIGTPKEVIREDGKSYLVYSNGFRQEIQQGWKTKSKATGRPIYEITFLDGSTASFRI